MGSDELAHLASLTLGRMLRAATYSEVRIVTRGGARQVRKHRAFYAPLLVSLGDPLVRMLDTGVRVLPQREWEERERLIYGRLYSSSIQIDDDGVLVLPFLPGQTLAALLENPRIMDADRAQAIALAVVALSRFHAAGFTHGDAMAENVMVDLHAGIAHWFDFETVHDATLPLVWRRADDVRALLVTCLLRTRRDQRANTLHLILDTCHDKDVARALAAGFGAGTHRRLVYHLSQAPLDFVEYREIADLLRGKEG